MTSTSPSLQNREILFISHAAPEDNDFTRWLSLQLIGLGYKVWSDVLKLKGGEDWWPVIENEIRNNSIKFIVVLSKASNNKEGVLKELAVAQKVKKQLNDPLFIVPVHIDPHLSYDDINIELNRLNSINFKKSWAEGLKNLMELLEEHNINKSTQNFEQVNNIWQTVYLHNKQPLVKDEVYSSNWFQLIEYPALLRFHNFKYAIPEDFDYSTLSFPIVKYKKYWATFAGSNDFINELPQTESYNAEESYNINVEDVLNSSFNSNFISTKEAKRIIVQLLNKGFEKSLSRKSVCLYQMSNKVSFYIKKGVLEKDKFNKVQLIGKQKDKQWHFGISGHIKLFPEKCFEINSHIWFTTDGVTLIPEASKQHSARRKQGKNWWNNDWRSKTLAFMQFVSENDNTFHIQLGSKEIAKVNMNPICFNSPISYLDPHKENLPDEYDYDEDIEETTAQM